MQVELEYSEFTLTRYNFGKVQMAMQSKGLVTLATVSVDPTFAYNRVNSPSRSW